MTQPTREEVKTFILALHYGMKVTHKPEFLITLAEGWLKSNEEKATKEWSENNESGLTEKQKSCDHQLYTGAEGGGYIYRYCRKCDIEIVSSMR